MVLAAAAAATGAEDPHGEPTGTAYELMKAQLYAHMRTLKNIQSVERKIEAKRTMLGDFEALCAKNGIRVVERVVMDGEQKITFLPNLLGSLAFYRVSY